MQLPNTSRRSRLVQAISTLSVKTQRVPSRHYRDERVYGHMTKAPNTHEKHVAEERTSTPSSACHHTHTREKYSNKNSRKIPPSTNHKPSRREPNLSLLSHLFRFLKLVVLGFRLKLHFRPLLLSLCRLLAPALGPLFLEFPERLVLFPANRKIACSRRNLVGLGFL